MLDHLVVLLQVSDDGRLDVEASIALSHPASHHLGVLGGALQEAEYPLKLIGVVDRGHERLTPRPFLEGRARGLGLLGEGCDEVVVDAGSNEHAGGGGAILTCVEVAGDRKPLRRRGQIGIIEDHNRRLATELEVYPFDILGRRFGNLHACAHRSGNGHHLRNGVFHEQAAAVAVTTHDVQHPWWQRICFGDDLRHPKCRDRGRVSGLQHDGVPRSDGRGELPDRHHHRVVPWCHLADDTDRFASNDRREALHVLTSGLAFQDSRGSREESDLVDHRRDLLGRRDRDGLARVLRFQGDEFIGMGLERVGDLQQGPLALRWRGVAPGLEGFRRSSIGRIDVGGIADRCRGKGLPSVGIDHLAARIRACIHRHATDEVP